MNKKWVAVWTTAPSFGEQREHNYAHDITLRYFIKTAIAGEQIRMTFSNHCSKNDVTLDKITVAPCANDVVDVSKAVALTFGGKAECNIAAGGETVSDAVDFKLDAGERFAVSIYLGGYVDMTTACASSGPSHKYAYATGDCTDLAEFPATCCDGMGYCYFLSEVDLLAHEKCRNILAFGDSITAQSWPEHLLEKVIEKGIADISVTRRAVSGSRVLRQYDCMRFARYGLKGDDRFVREIKTAGVDTVMILHGVNDIIHPEYNDQTGFRPISDLPTVEELCEGLRFYADTAHKAGLKVYIGTIMPIMGWRSYEDFREPIRQDVNEWIRTADCFDGVVDFDLEMKDSQNRLMFKAEYDSGDHLHPSWEGAKKMAEMVYDKLIGEN